MPHVVLTYPAALGYYALHVTHLPKMSTVHADLSLAAPSCGRPGKIELLSEEYPVRADTSLSASSGSRLGACYVFLEQSRLFMHKNVRWCSALPGSLSFRFVVKAVACLRFLPGPCTPYLTGFFGDVFLIIDSF